MWSASFPALQVWVVYSWVWWVLMIIPLQGRGWRDGGCCSHLEGLNIVNVPANLGGGAAEFDCLYGRCYTGTVIHGKMKVFSSRAWKGDSCERRLLRQHCQWRGSEGSSTRQGKGRARMWSWLELGFCYSHRECWNVNQNHTRVGPIVGKGFGFLSYSGMGFCLSCVWV